MAGTRVRAWIGSGVFLESSSLPTASLMTSHTERGGVMNLQAIFEIEFYPGHGFLDYSREPVKSVDEAKMKAHRLAVRKARPVKVRVEDWDSPHPHSRETFGPFFGS